MNTIQYSAWSGLLSVHKLFASCIWRCLVSCACDWVMSALCAVFLIFNFQFSLLFSMSERRIGLCNIGHCTSPNLFVWLSIWTRWCLCAGAAWVEASGTTSAFHCYWWSAARTDRLVSLTVCCCHCLSQLTIDNVSMVRVRVRRDSQP